MLGAPLALKNWFRHLLQIDCELPSSLAVIDLSAQLFSTPPDLIYRAWRKKAFELITSEWQLEELRRVSCYPKLRNYLKPAEVGTLVNGLPRHATVMQELPKVELSPAPDDNPLLATAIAGQADYLVTGDKRDLLSLEKVQACQIITARAFADRFGFSTAD